MASLIGAGAAFVGLIWRYRADYRRDILSKLLTDIQAAADLGTEYWLLDPSSKNLEISVTSRGLEAKIKGFSERLDSSIEAARPHLRRIDTLGMEKPWATFLDALAGGDFGDPMRKTDSDRATNAQVASAALIRDLRLAADRKVLGSL